MSPEHATVDRLRAWLHGRSDSAAEDLGLLGPIGEGVGGYWCSPPAGRVLAWTGGNGVHFTLVPADTPAGELVVMSVPMCFDEPNRVLGESLHEFLCLGVDTGFLGLESLAYGADMEQMISEARSVDRPTQLTSLVATFGLQPWSDVNARLAELDRALGDGFEVEAP